jgi:hypothetical protein
MKADHALGRNYFHKNRMVKTHSLRGGEGYGLDYGKATGKRKISGVLSCMPSV